MIDFRTQYDPVDRVPTVSGDEKVPEWQMRLDKSGKEFFEQTGEINSYLEIQSHAPSCDINMIIRRYVCGEEDVLSRVNGLYFDATSAPHNLAEMLNAVLAGEQTFDTLPADVRAKFNNSYSEWIAAMDDFDSWSVAMGLADAPASDPPAAPQKEVDS